MPDSSPQTASTDPTSGGSFHFVDWLAHLTEQVEETLAMISDELALDDVQRPRMDDVDRQHVDQLGLTNFPLEEIDWGLGGGPIDFA